MIKNTSGESLVGIIIGVFILSFIIIGITNLLINSKDIINKYENKKTISILKNNTENIIQKIDISKVNETEIFYLYKDNTVNEYKIFTGTINDEYKYIDTYGNKIDDLINFEGHIYSRLLLVERDDNIVGDNHQIIKISIKKLIKK